MQQTVNLNLVLDQVAKDKGIERPRLIETLEEAIAERRQAATSAMERNLKAKYDEDKGAVELFQVLTIVAEPTEEPHPDPANMIPVTVAQEKGIEVEAGRRAGLPDLLPRRGRGRGPRPGRAVRRPPQAQDLPPRLRPHRRPDRQAGHHPAHPRRRARERLQRVQGPQGRDHHRHRPPLRARQHHRRPGPRRGGAAGPRAGAARDLPRRRPHPGLRDSTCCASRRGRRSSSRAPRSSLLTQALRDGGPRDRRGHRGHRGRGPRAGRPRQDRRLLARPRRRPGRRLRRHEGQPRPGGGPGAARREDRHRPLGRGPGPLRLQRPGPGRGLPRAHRRGRTTPWRSSSPTTSSPWPSAGAARTCASPPSSPAGSSTSTARPASRRCASSPTESFDAPSASPRRRRRCSTPTASARRRTSPTPSPEMLTQFPGFDMDMIPEMQKQAREQIDHRRREGDRSWSRSARRPGSPRPAATRTSSPRRSGCRASAAWARRPSSS